MASVENHLIERLSRKDRLRLHAECEPVQLELAQVLCEPGEPTRHVYFPTGGSISLLTLTDGAPGLEISMVGREGMLGAQLALGVATEPFRALVQGPGMAWRVRSADFRRQLVQSDALRREVNRYLHVMMIQLARSAACLHFHRLAPRLARWLLMTQDRAHADNFPVTHEFLASMLSVRRVGITTAAGALQRSGLITYRRGHLTVLHRRGLEGAACACYAADNDTYAELMH